MEYNYNSTFKSKPRKPLKRSAFKPPNLPLRKEEGDRKPRSAPRCSKTVSRGPKLPAWIRAIPESQSHGSGTLQKRLWRVTSDFVRIRDWYRFSGHCVATGAYIPHWSQGDAGHWKSYSVCNGLFKFETLNIHLQSKSSNGWGGQEVGHNFAEELKRRWGPDILDVINDANKSHASKLKFTTEEVLARIQLTLEGMEILQEQPDYYARVVHLLSEEEKN